MAKLYGLIQQPLDEIVYRMTGGRATVSSWLSGIEISMLTTTGARTGRPRTLPVLALPEGEDVVLIASNFGRPRHPSWYHNLRANPHATIATSGVSREFVARELNGADRERSYARAERDLPPVHPLPPLGRQAPDTGTQTPTNRDGARHDLGSADPHTIVTMAVARDE